MSELKYWLKVLTSPKCWFRNHPTNKEWDRALIELLEYGEFSELGRYTVKLSGVEVWICNCPYCSYYPYPDTESLPSRRTGFKFREALDKYKVKLYTEEGQ